MVVPVMPISLSGDKTPEIGWTWIDPLLLQGSGINKHNKFLMLQYCFETLELNRVGIEDIRHQP